MKVLDEYLGKRLSKGISGWIPVHGQVSEELRRTGTPMSNYE